MVTEGPRMKTSRKACLFLIVVGLAVVAGNAADRATAKPMSAGSSPVYVIANQDLAAPEMNDIVFYQAQDTNLTFSTALATGGFGIQGGFFGTTRLNSVPSLSASCLYVSNSGSNTIATISLSDQQLVDVFPASDSDDGSENGVGLAVNANFLYANFTASSTIATFALQPGCGLTFLGDVTAVGLQGGSPSGMAANATTLVVAYGDGSIESFNITGGVPVSNHDLQNSNGYGGAAIIAPRTTGNLPTSVDLTQDGKFAIFGDISAYTTVEVSSLASGKLGRTTVYTLGNSADAGNIRLSPDHTLLYISNSEGGTVTAAFFDPATGKLTPGCTSATLNGFNSRPWLGSVVTRDTAGTGNVVYIAEFGRDYLEVNHGPSSEIGILTVTSNGSSCTLTETQNSPVSLARPGTLTIGVYPPRPF